MELIVRAGLIHIFRTALAVAIASAPLVPSYASAELLPIDLFATGDQLITRDTSSGLEWLDLTATINMSAEDIRTGSGGWQSLGFGHATIAQVRALFLASDPANAVINTGENPTSTQNLSGALLLLHLLGVTHPGPSTNDFDVLGNGIAGVDEPSAGLIHFADFGTNTDKTFGFFFVPDGIAPSNFRDTQVGNFLVRYSSDPTPISAPSSFVLESFSLALLTTLSLRRNLN